MMNLLELARQRVARQEEADAQAQTLQRQQAFQQQIRGYNDDRLLSDFVFHSEEMAKQRDPQQRAVHQEKAQLMEREIERRKLVTATSVPTSISTPPTARPPAPAPPPARIRSEAEVQASIKALENQVAQAKAETARLEAQAAANKAAQDKQQAYNETVAWARQQNRRS